MTINRKPPVVEWVLKLRNESDEATSLIENVLPLDLSFERNGKGEFTLHHSNGSPHSLVRCQMKRTMPRETILGPESFKELAPIGLICQQ